MKTTRRRQRGGRRGHSKRAPRKTGGAKTRRQALMSMEARAAERFVADSSRRSQTQDAPISIDDDGTFDYNVFIQEVQARDASIVFPLIKIHFLGHGNDPTANIINLPEIEPEKLILEKVRLNAATLPSVCAAASYVRIVKCKLDRFPNLSGCPNLGHLIIEHCKFTERGSTAGGYPPDIRILRIVHNNLTDVPDVPPLWRLLSLDLSKNRLRRIPLQANATYPDLAELFLGDNDITEMDVLQHVQLGPECWQLHLDNNRIKHLVPLDAICENVDVSGNPIEPSDDNIELLETHYIYNAPCNVALYRDLRNNRREIALASHALYDYASHLPTDIRNSTLDFIDGDETRKKHMRTMYGKRDRGERII